MTQRDGSRYEKMTTSEKELLLRLDPEERNLVLELLADYSTLTVEKAIERLRLSGM
jgi:hypothetical protein